MPGQAAYRRGQIAGNAGKLAQVGDQNRERPIEGTFFNGKELPDGFFSLLRRKRIGETYPVRARLREVYAGHDGNAEFLLGAVRD